MSDVSRIVINSDCAVVQAWNAFKLETCYGIPKASVCFELETFSQSQKEILLIIEKFLLYEEIKFLSQE